MFGQCLSMEKEVLHLMGATFFKQDQLSSDSICAISNKEKVGYITCIFSKKYVEIFLMYQYWQLFVL